MRAVQPIKVIEKGVAVYVPTVEGYSFVKIEIYYTETNPIFEWATCNGAMTKIWEKRSTREIQDKNGTLFIYNTKVNLRKGFYKISITAFNSTGGFLSGELVVGIHTDKERLVIGMPYSAYEPITLS